MRQAPRGGPGSRTHTKPVGAQEEQLTGKSVDAQPDRSGGGRTDIAVSWSAESTGPPRHPGASAHSRPPGPKSQMGRSAERARQSNRAR